MSFELFKRPPIGGNFKGHRHTLEKRKQMSESSKGKRAGRKGRLLLNVYELIKITKLKESK